MTEALADMRAAAAAAGRAYETFRKIWRELVRDGFPAPVEDRRPYRWRPSSLEAWQARAEAATAQALRAPAPPANENRALGPAPAARPAAIQRGRAAVARLMGA